MDDMKVTNDLLDFLEASPTAFHAVNNIRNQLKAVGYTELRESEIWELVPGGRYFTVRNESALIAFRIPEEPIHGFMIAASHSDSPAFKVKANPEMNSADAYTTLNVEKYGGMLIYPWFDRPLSVAGRVLLKREDGTLETRLVNIDRDLCMIPSLAIHMDRDANKGHELNVQKELIPIFGDQDARGRFMELVAEAAMTTRENIVGDDLFLYVRGRGSVCGASQEYVSAGHLDDLQCSFADLKGFLRSDPVVMKATTMEDLVRRDNASGTAPVLAIFDNEEVGSGSKQGADSTYISDVLNRIRYCMAIKDETFRCVIANSFMLSVDNAHAVHPNYADKSDPVNRPKMNGGIVMKYNANQKYTTDGVSSAVFKLLCEREGLKYQEFTNRSDMAGGSTLGNIANAHVSLNTVDIGLPQLAMHSPYETAGVKDTADLIQLTERFFQSEFEDLGMGRFALN